MRRGEQPDLLLAGRARSGIECPDVQAAAELAGDAAPERLRGSLLSVGVGDGGSGLPSWVAASLAGLAEQRDPLHQAELSVVASPNSPLVRNRPGF